MRILISVSKPLIPLQNLKDLKRIRLSQMKNLNLVNTPHLSHPNNILAFGFKKKEKDSSDKKRKLNYDGNFFINLQIFTMRKSQTKDLMIISKMISQSLMSPLPSQPRSKFLIFLIF